MCAAGDVGTGLLLSLAASRESCPLHCPSLMARLQGWHWRWSRDRVRLLSWLLGSVSPDLLLPVGS